MPGVGRPDARPRHEAERGLKVVADLLPVQETVPPVVRDSRDAEACRRRRCPSRLIVGRATTNRSSDDVPVAVERRRGESCVGADQRVARRCRRDCRSSRSPPIHDCSNRFRLTRAANRFCRAERSHRGASTRLDVQHADVVVRLPPDDLRAGTRSAPRRRCPRRRRPMRRVKNGIRSVPPASPATSNTPAPSRKNVRFSGKNSGNRVRLT